MAGRPEVRTMFAMQAVSLSASFTEMFGRLKIPPGYTADMTAPEGPSTGGGAQSVQHIRIHAPEHGPTLVMGHADQNLMKATLRSHAYLTRLAQQRGFTLSVDPRSYNAFTARVKKFFEGLHFIVTLEEGEPAPAEVRTELVPTTPAPQPSSKFGLGLLVGLGLGGGLGALIMFLLLRR